MSIYPHSFTLAMGAKGFRQQKDGSWKSGPSPSSETSTTEGVDRESTLQTEIREWCSKKWPEWIPYGPRFGVKSTVGEGAADLVVFGPFPIVIVVETKAGKRKQDGPQLAWACKMNALGWTVHVVRNFDQWLEIAGGKI